MLHTLREKVQRLGKREWRPLLLYAAELHEKSLHPPVPPLPYMWEDAFSTKSDGLYFGHWDTVHIAIDLATVEPKYAREQASNYLILQHDNGFLPAAIILDGALHHLSTTATAPPLWPVVVGDSYSVSRDDQVLEAAYSSLVKQVLWFERHRRVANTLGGYYYLDVTDCLCESGVQGSPRFDRGTQYSSQYTSCLDATAHMCLLLRYAKEWGKQLGEEVEVWEEKLSCVEAFIQRELFDEESGYFYDHAAIKDKGDKVITFEGIWPLLAHAASPLQAQSVVRKYLINPKQFFSAHPITTVAQDMPAFSLEGWRGASRNSMTYWAARGAILYGYFREAKELLEGALNATSADFAETGTVWEWYPSSTAVTPRPDFLGHNPVIAMACLWEELKRKKREPN